MSEETIFSEVDEELRSERMRNLWRRFGPFVIGAAVLIVVMVGVNEGWRWYQNSVSARSSDQFYSAISLIENGDSPAALIALDETVASGSGSYPVLARFAKAALLAKDGKLDEAVAAYDALSTDLSQPRLRDVALVLAASNLVDKGDVKSVEARVGGLIAPDNALRNVARELVGLARYASGDAKGASEIFAQIVADPGVSLDLLRRVQIYQEQLLSQGIKPPVTKDALANPASLVTTATPAVANETPPTPGN
ncbi:hypothetical protein MNBD_ALPHA12-1868 [hydrothermal vent metagenome]|uniref:Ancillary SecYEG translocon subunit/Cell division coordinator CpoB TPR domain-containing protein n=1 Tax=hydrothermal vent metagenome TaxID=652676 RepID=A0A3B0TXD3_9ZZZZ